MTPEDFHQRLLESARLQTQPQPKRGKPMKVYVFNADNLHEDLKCRLEAERDEAIARGVRLWEWAAHDALIRCAFNMAVLPDTLWNEETRAFVEAVETAKDEGL